MCELQDAIRTPHWKVSATSVCGSSHEKRDLPCQDASCWTTHADGTLIAAVSDGAGSASHSHIGAQVATQTAVEFLASKTQLQQHVHNNTYTTHLTQSLKSARKAVQAEAKLRNLKPRDLASTLIVSMATPHAMATAQIGDGASILQTPTTELIALTTPDSGEYINQTTFLISPKAIQTAQYHIWHGPLTHLALFSDGLQMLALQMPFGKPHRPFFTPLFQFITKAGESAQDQLTSFLQSPRVRTRTDDDLTLLLATVTQAHETENPA